MFLYQKVKQQWRRLCSQMGFIDSLFYLANRILGFISSSCSLSKYYFVSQGLSKQPLVPNGKGKQLRVVELSSEWTESHPCPRPTSVIADRYEQGTVCLTAYKADEFAGCLWYAKSHYKEDEVRCLYELPAKQVVWDFDVYVVPKFRLSPVFLKLWDTASARLVQEGVEWSFSRISAFNPMSLSSHKRMGANIVGWAIFVRMGTIQFAFSSLKPFLHVSFSDASYPTFKFDLPSV